MSFACPICGKSEAASDLGHRCSKRALARAEKAYRDEEAAEEENPNEPDFEERLRDGFEMNRGDFQ